MIEAEPVIDALPWPTPVEVVAGARAVLGRAPLAWADCQRCGAPAHPIRGYCGRLCEEAERYDARRRSRERRSACGPCAPRIQNLDPPTPEETAYAEAYAAIERDTDEALRRDVLGGDR